MLYEVNKELLYTNPFNNVQSATSHMKTRTTKLQIIQIYSMIHRAN